MRRPIERWMIALMLFSLLAACTPQASTPPGTGSVPVTAATTAPAQPSGTTAPTSTEAPTGTTAPSETAAVLPTGTNTPLPSATPTPRPRLVSQYLLSAAGFSVVKPQGLLVDVRQDQAIFTSPDQTFYTSLYGSKADAGARPENLMASWKSTLAGMFSDFVMSEPQPVVVANWEGLTANISGKLKDGDAAGTPISGRVLMVVLLFDEQFRLFSSIGFSIAGGGQDRWAQDGAKLNQAILDAVTFTAPIAGAEQCAVSSDPAYGYDPANPIRLGPMLRQGSLSSDQLMDPMLSLQGAKHETAYLGNLLGPKGEAVTYERRGSETVGDVILDKYEVTYPGQAKPVTLFVDMYTYENLMAPAGFTCRAAIPILAPQ